MRSLKAITWTAIVSFGLFCSPGLLTRADAITIILDLNPLSSSIDVGGSVTFTVNASISGGGGPVTGASIDFQIIAPPPITNLGSNNTDASGIAALLETFSTAGTFTVEASTSNGVGLPPITSNDVTVTVNSAATPLPAALPLFATGLGGLGLLGWRRKRKARQPEFIFAELNLAVSRV